MSLIKECLKNSRSQISKLLSPRLTTVVRVSYPVAKEPDYYKAGGFHPISLGDSFQNGQYTILRKLGYGQYSAVWLARDAKHQKYVALKVLRADYYGGSHDIFEREILSKILEVSRHSSHQGRNYVSHLLEQFTHTGSNGDRVCLAFDYEDGKLPLLLAFDFLHRECGIIHTDLKPTNILLELKNPSRTIANYLSEVPARTLPQRGVNTPLREVIPTSLVSEKVSTSASWKERRLSDLIQSQAMRAPEVTMGAPWDTGVDIWSLGCLVMELVQGIVLFSGDESSNGTWTAEDDHLARIMEVLARSLLRLPDLTTNPFLKPIDMPEAEVPIFVDFLKGMLEIDPGSRKPAAELLQHEWVYP
ncbi:protein kinase [Aspergillus pseudonomiae]|uniref:non-specific serine/threonine protein kinase n=1 Tax=Aspergillus pseudonomiae TaxID=1506151 RepID=A0A5N7CV41_9EURO|nr:protein kinase [Aspergillus pseudonomiae]KAE8398052.1 protein kinase [Aspergillus pseudonomiae]